MTLADRARRLNPARRPGTPPLLAMSDGTRGVEADQLARTLPAGCAVVLRDYHHPERRRLAITAAQLTRQRRLLLLVAGDGRLAALVRANGVHLPEAMLRSGRLAPLLGWARTRGWRLTAACHTMAAVAVANRLNLDGAVISPVFPTASHPGQPAMGPLRFAILARRATCSVYALGGVTQRTLARLRSSGAAGVAAIGGALT